MDSIESAMKEASFFPPPSCLILSLNLNPGSGLPGKRKTNLGIGMKKRETLLQGDLGRNLGQVRIICTLGKMGQHDVPGDAIEAITNPVGHVFIGEMTKPRQNPLL